MEKGNFYWVKFGVQGWIPAKYCDNSNFLIVGSDGRYHTDQFDAIGEQIKMEADDQDICGLCGQPGADKIPHPEHWPGERIPNAELVHAECEEEECRRAHTAFYNRVGDGGVREFLHNL